MTNNMNQGKATEKQSAAIKKLPSVSVIICCYNSASRVGQTLEHLVRQELPAGFEWELVVVNNASTDDTVRVVESFRDKFASGTLKIVDETRPGLSYARYRGIQEAKKEIICFLDDDNWVGHRHLIHLASLFQNNPEVVAAGGPLEAVCESEPPFWFETYKQYFSVWEPDLPAGCVKRPLYGAGLSLRRSVILELYESGFKSRLSDRKGKQLNSGGDFELCYELMKRGGKLYYDPALKIRHFMPEARLKWSTLRRLHAGFGRQSLVLESYENSGSRSWWKETARSLFCLIRFTPRFLRNREGDVEVLLFLNQWGRLWILISHPRIFSH